MQYLLDIATWVGLGVMASLPILVVVTVLDHKDRKRHRAAMAEIEARHRT